MSEKYFTLDGQPDTNEAVNKPKQVKIMVEKDGKQVAVSVSEFKQIMLEYDDQIFYKKLMEEISKNGGE